MMKKFSSGKTRGFDLGMLGGGRGGGFSPFK
jgi:hypothetical protein